MEEQSFISKARIDNIVETDNLFKDSDPFVKSWDEIKNFSGIDNNFKRRINRVAKNFVSPQYMDSASAQPTGINGARSTQINPGVVYRNAYGIFDVITPPWNLYELANYYDTSFANHSAIDAKVENIVGLGLS